MKTLTTLLLTALLIPVCSVCAQTSPDELERKAREDKVND